MSTKSGQKQKVTICGAQNYLHVCKFWSKKIKQTIEKSHWIVKSTTCNFSFQLSWKLIICYQLFDIPNSLELVIISVMEHYRDYKRACAFKKKVYLLRGEYFPFLAIAWNISIHEISLSMNLKNTVIFSFTKIKTWNVKVCHHPKLSGTKTISTK